MSETELQQPNNEQVLESDDSQTDSSAAANGASYGGGEQNAPDKQDFSHYTWFNGVNQRFNAVTVATHEDRIFVGMKGYDKKAQTAGYISAEFARDQLERLAAHIQELLAVTPEPEPAGAATASAAATTSETLQAAA